VPDSNVLWHGVCSLVQTFCPNLLLCDVIFPLGLGFVPGWGTV